MFDVGFFEIALVLLIGLLVLGPERLPGVARTLGGWMRRARSMVNGIRQEFDREVARDDWKREIDRQKDQFREIQARLEGKSDDGADKDRHDGDDA